jgi:hypothetical protein
MSRDYPQHSWLCWGALQLDTLHSAAAESKVSLPPKKRKWSMGGHGGNSMPQTPVEPRGALGDHSLNGRALARLGALLVAGDGAGTAQRREQPMLHEGRLATLCSSPVALQGADRCRSQWDVQSGEWSQRSSSSLAASSHEKRCRGAQMLELEPEPEPALQFSMCVFSFALSVLSAQHARACNATWPVA